MIIIVGALVAIASVQLFGGDLRRLGTLPIRRAWLAWAAILTQTALVSGPWHTAVAAGRVLHVCTYAMVAAFAFSNRRLPGIVPITVGGALNLLAIASNGGEMPASAAALRLSGLSPAGGFTNSGPVHDAHLAWLGDVFAVPAGWPLANVFSIGDIVIVLGVGVLAHRWCRTSTSASTSTSTGQVPADVEHHVGLL